ncbi:MAG: hypothetical protein M1834_007832, partial [Cirrosporium novae-zelandiae]
MAPSEDPFSELSLSFPDSPPHMCTTMDETPMTRPRGGRPRPKLWTCCCCNNGPNRVGSGPCVSCGHEL